MTFSLHRTKRQCSAISLKEAPSCAQSVISSPSQRSLLFVLGLKIVVPTTDADASAVQSSTLNVLQMQLDYVNYLHAQPIRDMTFALD